MIFSRTPGSFSASCRIELCSSTERPRSVTAFTRALWASSAMRSLSDGSATLIIFLHAGHLFQCIRRRIELLVWNVLRRFGGTRRRRSGLSVRYGNGEKPRDGHNCGGERQHQKAHRFVHACRHLLTAPAQLMLRSLESGERDSIPGPIKVAVAVRSDSMRREREKLYTNSRPSFTNC
jgi:hypothetical protein